jgi:hypothetical protein
MQFSKNKKVRNIQYTNTISTQTSTIPIIPLFSSQYRKYDMIAIANSGSTCNFCNR